MQKYKRRMALLLALFQIMTAKTIAKADNEKVMVSSNERVFYRINHKDGTVVIVDDESDLDAEFDESKTRKQVFKNNTSKTTKDDKENDNLTYEVISEDNNLYLGFDGTNNYYRRFNENSGKYEPISIFDEENIASKQYGASQKDFKDRFDSIINDSLIMEEMQKYYPMDEFDSEDEALYFYQKYFEIIYRCGCGYVAAANYVFRLYEGREDEFYNTFLNKYGIYSLTHYDEIAKDFFVDDIIASEDFKLYKTDSDGNEYTVINNVGSHYVYITGITEDGKIVVSSWGERYIFDDSNALWTSKILIKKLN